MFCSFCRVSYVAIILSYGGSYGCVFLFLLFFPRCRDAGEFVRSVFRFLFEETLPFPSVRAGCFLSFFAFRSLLFLVGVRDRPRACFEFFCWCCCLLLLLLCMFFLPFCFCTADCCLLLFPDFFFDRAPLSLLAPLGLFFGVALRWKVCSRRWRRRSIVLFDDATSVSTMFFSVLGSAAGSLSISMAVCSVAFCVFHFWIAAAILLSISFFPLFCIKLSQLPTKVISIILWRFGKIASNAKVVAAVSISSMTDPFSSMALVMSAFFSYDSFASLSVRLIYFSQISFFFHKCI